MELKCNRCGKTSEGFATNYKGEKICYQCCGAIDREELASAKPGERFCYYLTEDGAKHSVSNWPGTLKISVFPRRSRHNFGLIRKDFWFSVGKANFHGYQIGNNSQIAHITCVK